MDTIAFLAALVLVPSLLALLAIRFGADSRPAFQSEEHRLAMHGVTWEPARIEPATMPARRARIASPDPNHPYPTLATLDAARGPGARSFASDLHAAQLEPIARALVADYWPNTAWLTGLLSAEHLEAVVTRLEARRDDLDREVRVFVIAEQPTRAART